MLINWLIASSVSLRITYQDKKIHSRKGRITFQTIRHGDLHQIRKVQILGKLTACNRKLVEGLTSVLVRFNHRKQDEKCK